MAPLGCLTDGNPVIQQAKLAATGLLPLLPTVLVTDTLGGRAARKPAPVGLLALADAMGVPAGRLLVIGDRPGKDVAVAAAVGARAIRIRQGEYASAPDEPRAEAVVDSFPAAVAVALGSSPVPPCPSDLARPGDTGGAALQSGVDRPIPSRWSGRAAPDPGTTPWQAPARRPARGSARGSRDSRRSR